ncbi:MAG: ABC transporter ATP-binding protein [Eubacteriales bacterium]
MNLLKVKNLNKSYEKFQLKDVSFSLDEGYIMGFIGENGAGKTTTLKSILNLIKPNSGTVEILGQDFYQNELALKQYLGFTFGGGDFYSNSTLSTISNVVARFYKSWDDTAYQGYLQRFSLDPTKKLKELSSGMQVKFSLALALSHQAKLLLLDEPTSGLDPVARDDLLEVFQELVEDGDKSILFSTHITSDLEKCADFITFIHNGRILESQGKDQLIESYRLVKGSADQLDSIKNKLVSYKTHSFGFTGLIKQADIDPALKLTLDIPTLEDIMIYHVKKENNNEKSHL